MNAIAIVDKNWGLGWDGKLLAHLPGELKYFREKTKGKTIIIGRGTYESMSCKLLPGRKTVILSRSENFKADCPVFRSAGEALEYLKGTPSEDIFVAGGESVYREMYHNCDKFYITIMHKTFDADRHFPNLDEEPGKFDVKELSGIITENGIKYQIFKYERKNER